MICYRCKLDDKYCKCSDVTYSEEAKEWCQECRAEYHNFMGGYTLDENGKPIIIKYCHVCNSKIGVLGVDDDMESTGPREVIENALYSTGNYLTDQCTDLAEGILLFIKDHGYKISRQ